MRRIAIFAAVLSVSASPALSAGVSVPIDEVRTVAFDRPIATVYVGNPAVADVTMIDLTHAFVLGKSFGSTNMLALISRGTQVTNEHITVLGRGEAVVTLNRGSSQLTYACASSRCETAPLPGDAKDPYDTQMRCGFDASGRRHQGRQRRTLTPTPQQGGARVPEASMSHPVPPKSSASEEPLRHRKSQMNARALAH